MKGNTNAWLKFADQTEQTDAMANQNAQNIFTGKNTREDQEER